jgi:hypothetical protein
MKLSVFVLAVLGIASALWVTQCSGPRPTVTAVQMQPPTAPGAPYQIQATVQNNGLGHGEAQLTFRLRNPATGASVQEERNVSLDNGETTVVVASLNAPQASYVPEVEATYPPGK